VTNNGIVKIHGKDYMTVARRLELAHESKEIEGVVTEVLSHDPVVVKATVTIKGRTYTGISAVNLESPRLIERDNPYEVAETSAVGRALGFAGYGLLESVASADEMVRAVSAKTGDGDANAKEKEICDVCGKPAHRKKGVSKGGRKYEGIFCSSGSREHTRWIWSN